MLSSLFTLLQFAQVFGKAQIPLSCILNKYQKSIFKVFVFMSAYKLSASMLSHFVQVAKTHTFGQTKVHTVYDNLLDETANK